LHISPKYESPKISIRTKRALQSDVLEKHLCIGAVKNQEINRQFWRRQTQYQFQQVCAFFFFAVGIILA